MSKDIRKRIEALENMDTGVNSPDLVVEAGASAVGALGEAIVYPFGSVEYNEYMGYFFEKRREAERVRELYPEYGENGIYPDILEYGLIIIENFFSELDLDIIQGPSLPPNAVENVKDNLKRIRAGEYSLVINSPLNT